jgi:hypothetical protein
MNNLSKAPPDLNAIPSLVASACRGYPVARLQVFGSVAKGAAHPGSDVDFLVEFMPGANVGLFEMGGLKEDLEESLGCPVDLLSRPAVERSRNSYRRTSILADPVTVYAQ